MSYFIMRLQYIQEQSRQAILPGLELFYGHPPFGVGLCCAYWYLYCISMQMIFAAAARVVLPLGLK